MRRITPLLAFWAALACARAPEQRLLRAAELGDPATVAALLAAGTDVDCRDRGGWTPLMHAAAHGDAESVRILIAHGASPFVTTRRDEQGPLILAARWNRVEVVRAVLQFSKRIDREDSIGWPALMWAAHLGRTDVVAALLDAGADPNCRDSDHNTPLINAARRGHLATVKLLLAHGAKRQSATVNGDTAETLALRGGHAEVAALLKGR